MYSGIYNRTNDSISLYVTNERGEKTERQLTVMENGFIIIRNIPEGTIFIQEKDGVCIAKYQNRRNSILLIE